MINGEAGSRIDVGDRGLHYGDGVFETMAVLKGVARNFDAHMQRLARGCKRLGFAAPCTTLIAEEIGALCENRQRAVVKLIVTRGSGDRGYAPPPEAMPCRTLLRYEWPAGIEARRKSGVAVHTCETRLAINPALAGIKHLNRLEQVLAAKERAGSEFAEGLMLDTEGTLIEATHSNVFLVQDGGLVTPSLDHCGVAGIMRAKVIDVADRAGIFTKIVKVAAPSLNECQEMFLTNSLMGVVPVVQLDQRKLPAGKLTRRLQSLLYEGASP